MKHEALIAELPPEKADAARVIIMIGAPAAGKSTWREAYVASSPRPTVIVSTDDLIEEISAATGQTYSEVFATHDMDALARTASAQFRFAIANRHDVIVDRTNMSVKSRNKYLSQVPKHYARIGLVFWPPREVLFARLEERGLATGKIIPRGVVEDMLNRFQAPTAQEFDLIRVFA